MTTLGRFSFPRLDTPNTQDNSPLFERMGSDEFAELQSCRQIIESLEEKVRNLERISKDLEFRLEDQAKQCMTAEKECILVKREWKGRCDALQSKIEGWEREYSALQVKSDKLREHSTRTERELYGILQRKYEFMRGSGGRNPTTSRNSESASLLPVDSYGAMQSMTSDEYSQNPQVCSF